MAVEDLRQKLTSLLADNTYWAIFAELEKTPEADRARILRPHDAIRLHELREFEAIRQRAQLDKALGRLTLLEIGFETGLLPEGLSKAQAWLEQDLGDFRKLVTESESFFGYAGAYLYFGARILAYRCFGAAFRSATLQQASQLLPAPLPLDYGAASSLRSAADSARRRTSRCRQTTAKPIAAVFHSPCPRDSICLPGNRQKRRRYSKRSLR